MSRSYRPAAAEASYCREPYRTSYADILKQHKNPDVAVAELFLFRFWLAEQTCQLRALDRSDGGEMPVQVVSTVPPSGWRAPENVEGVDIEAALGSGIATLLESRFNLYDRFFTLGRSTSDLLGLKATSLALACQLFEEPPPAVLAYLTEKATEQFITLSDACESDDGNVTPC